MAAEVRPRKLRRTDTLPIIPEPLPRYSQKGRDAYDKMLHQTIRAIHDPAAESTKAFERYRLPSPPPLARRATDLSSQPQGAQAEGSRPYQEDRLFYPVKVLLEHKGIPIEATLFGILDGHGDDGRAADFVKENLKFELEKRLNEKLETADTLDAAAIGDAFTQVFTHLAKTYQYDYYRIDGKCGGTTVCCALRIGNKIYFPNVGDSRVILIKSGKFFQLSEDADLQNPRFTTWHKNQGNTIAKVRGVWRVFRPNTPAMGLARAVGGHTWMCCRPKISCITIGDGEDDPEKGKIFCNHRDVLIFVSDGVTAKMTTRGIVEMFNRYRDTGMSHEEIANQIAAQAGASAGSDNSSVLIVPIRANSN
ncbi:MAG: protein phosphatase 2C domain-containing protein [Parachlamydiales bacterium]|nr:protein phosphatase 2C domain-containing protein [Parachlamydiales bacterium]